MKSDGQIDDMPTRAGLKQLKSFDLYEGLDDELVDDYRDFMSWFFQRDHATLNAIPVRESTGFFIDGFEDSAFNTEDFQKDIKSISLAGRTFQCSSSSQSILKIFFILMSFISLKEINPHSAQTSSPKCAKPQNRSMPSYSHMNQSQPQTKK